jgi:hypothetical protein
MKVINRSFSIWALLCATLLTFAFDSSVASAADTNPANWGARKNISFDDLKRNLAQPDMIYAPFAFWFWDEPLQPGKAAQMAAKMLRQRLNPGYPHARMSQAGTPDLPRSQWLSPRWFKEIDGALRSAESAGGYLGYVDEYWWPSGRAAGRVLQNNPDLWAVSLKWTTMDVDSGQWISAPESFFTVAAQIVTELPTANAPAGADYEIPPHQPAIIRSNSLRIIGAGNPFNWYVPTGGRWRLYSFTKYFHPGADGARINYLDKRLSSAFIKLAHEPYEEYFSKRMGKSMPGVFVDNEGDYGYKLAWSDDLAADYHRKFNSDIRLSMPLMFDQDIEGSWPKVRWRWFEVVSDVYSEYLGGVGTWLQERGMYCISNLWEETLMWQAAAVGDFFKAQRAYSLPGTDCLGLNVLKPHDFKETQSVCEFESRRFHSEIMGAAGWWQFKPHNIKQASNAAAAWGISHVVPHGIYMTRKFDNHPWLPDWYDENPMWPYMHLWTDFVRRNSYINSQGFLAADVLLLNPMDSVWALCGPGVFDPAVKGRVPGPAVLPLQTDKDIPQTREQLKLNSAWWCAPKMDEWFCDEVRHINKTYSDAMADMTANRIEYLIADRHYVRQMKVVGNRLVRGPFSFKTLVIPPVVIMPTDVAEKIVAFAHDGGSVFVLGQLPDASVENGANDPRMLKLMKDLSALPSVTVCPKDLKYELQRNHPCLQSHIRFESASFEMLQQHRRIDGRDFFWLANNDANGHTCTLLVSDARGAASIWNTETGNIRPLASKAQNAGSKVTLTFEPFEGYWLVFDPDADAIEITSAPTQTPVSIAELDGPWQVTVDMSVQPNLEHPAAPPAELTRPGGDIRDLAQWPDWGLKGFSGYVDYRRTFEYSRTDKRITLDLGKVQHMAQVWVNGKDCGMRLWPPFTYDISDPVKPGQNQIHIRTGNLVNDSYGQPSESGIFGPVIIRSQTSEPNVDNMSANHR